MIKAILEEESARVKAAHAEERRVELFAELDARLIKGDLTPKEVAQFKREFWDSLYEAAKILRARTRPARRLPKALSSPRWPFSGRDAGKQDRENARIKKPSA